MSLLYLMPRARDGPAREQRSSKEERKNGERQSDKRKVAPRLLRTVGFLLEYWCRGRYGTGCALTRMHTANVRYVGYADT